VITEYFIAIMHANEEHSRYDHAIESSGREENDENRTAMPFSLARSDMGLSTHRKNQQRCKRE
jgi:hypothetical protein